MSSQASPGHARILTFGIEFEFLVARHQGGRDPHPQDTRWTIPFGTLANSNEDSVELEVQDFVVSLLKRNQIPALSDIRLNGPRIEDPNIKYIEDEANAQGVQVVPDRVATHAFWVITGDQGITMIEGEDIDGYEYVDMEVVSRILPETKFAEVGRVYTLMQSHLRTQVNSSCGLHYHVGIGHLSVEAIKKLVTLLMVAEGKGLFENICAPHRRYPPNIWCKPVSEYSRAVMYQDSPPRDLRNHSLEHHLPQYHGISSTLYRGLIRIWNGGTVDEVAKETQTFSGVAGVSAESTFSRRGGFALRNFTMAHDIRGFLVPADLTIEFRYKESTGSASQDYHWLQLCLGLVRGAEWPQERFRDAIGDLTTANTLEGQLVGLGVDGNEVRWWLETNQHHRNHPNPAKRTRFLEPENF